MRGIRGAGPLVSLLLLAGAVTLPGAVRAGGGPASALSPSLRAHIDRIAEEALKNGPVPGVALTVVRGDQVLYQKAYGYADQENRLPMGTNSQVFLGSTGKGFTALAVMQLVEQGKVNLDAPVQSYLPFFGTNDPGGARITVRHLLSHTSGVTPGPNLDDRWPGPLEQDVRQASRGLRFVNDPGRVFDYQTLNFAAAGLIVEQVSGLPYREYVRRNLLAPLNMPLTGFAPNFPGPARTLVGYPEENGQLQRVVLTRTEGYSEGASPAGPTWVSTAEDLTNYLTMLLGGGTFRGRRVISAASLAEMQRPQVETDGPTERYGLGWLISTRFGRTSVYHPGSEGIGGSYLYLVPGQKLAIGVLYNGTSDNPATRGLARRVADTLLNRVPEPQAP